MNSQTTIDIVVGHSPDADDAYMFYALTAHKIDTGRYLFRHALHDIETLNQKARLAQLPITAISVAAYPDVADKYYVMRSGASFGDGYGPVLVTRAPATLDSIRGKSVAVPGLKTSAYLALCLAAPPFKPVVVPFDQIMGCVSRGEADAGLLIHEGQLTYREEGFHLVIDLGVWWKDRTGGLPLPLGINAIRRDLDPEVLADLTRLFSESIAYAFAHPGESVPYAMTFSRGLDRPRTDKFVRLYVNDLTVRMGERGESAIRRFLQEGVELGKIKSTPLDFV